MIRIEPSEISPAVPIVVAVDRPDREIWIEPVSEKGLDRFPVPLKSTPDGEWQAQFSLHYPGTYAVVFGGERQEFVVVPANHLGFGLEFGLTAGLVLFFFAGVLTWAVRQRKAS